ncbi:nicotinate phosphoribosyltransferase [Patescibacteria group bacterium]|nr:nicotinate phosphoribosyltransferase [Patescibacteria group bacterium]
MIKKIRKGYYSAVYFNKTKQILLKENNLQSVTIQIFQKQNNAILCGINQVIELLKIGTGYFEDKMWVPKYDTLAIKALSEGNIIKNREPVMHITGPYAYFAHLESLYLGILARQTRIATNARKMVTAANGKPVLFFADRFDYFLNQEVDGYAAHIGGVTNICTLAQGKWFNGEAVGTIPHALIAVNNGDTIKTTSQYAKYFPKSPLIALVDFENDCVRTALQTAKHFGEKLWGIRLDTSENMVDNSLKESSENKSKLRGVNPTLVKTVREALNKQGFSHVKIITSGGFNEEKILWFEKERAPVDIYAVGSSMFDGKNDFTADVVKVEGKKIAKIGRKYISSPRMKLL